MAQSFTSLLNQEQDPWLGMFPPRRWHLLLAAVVLTVVYLAGVTALWWPTPDSGLYQSLAKSLLAGEGYRYNGRPSTAVTPGLPLLLAGIKAVFGDQADWAANLAIALCGLAMLLATYLAMARIAGRRMALAVALAVGLTYKTYELSHLVLTDIPFAAVFWWLVYLCLRYASGARRLWLVVIAALVAVGMTVRAPGLLLLLALAPAMVLDRGSSAPARRRWAVAGVVAGTAAVLALAYYLAATIFMARLPPYAATLGERLGTAVGVLERVKAALLLPATTPDVLAEMIVNQESIVAGVMVLTLGLVGLVSLWMRGRRLTPTVTVLCFVGLVLVAGSEAIRERYLLTIYPMIVLSILEGLCAGVAGASALARRNRRAALALVIYAEVVLLGAAGWAMTAALLGWPLFWPLSVCAVAGTAAVLAPMGLLSLRQPPGKSYLQVVSVVVGMIALANLPRLARNAFYYGYLGRGDAKHYYATIRHGQFAELFDELDLLRTAGPPQARIAILDDLAPIVHYLTGRIVAPVRETPCDTAAQADAVYERYLATGAELVVTGAPQGPVPYRERLQRRFAETGELAVIHAGKQLLVYQRVAPLAGASQPASAPQSP